ncbi:MAG: DNA repair protein RecO [Firmicutes bacterium]|nr:DNA repair protein RecO [Bacillota bacterium]
MYLTTKALVLRVTDVPDRDALLTLLTPSHGRLTAKARGLRRKNSPLIAPGQLLAYGEYTLFEYRGSYTVNEAAAIELFPNLRRDLGKLSLGTYFAQAAELISQEDLPNPELLSLTLNCLHALSGTALPEEMVKAVFELRLACLAGFQPDLSACHSCGNPNPDCFAISAGALECAVCRDASLSGIRLPISAGTLQAMRYICSCEPKRLFSFRLGAENLQQLSQVTESYLLTQLEHGFSTLDFYKSLNLGASNV